MNPSAQLLTSHRSTKASSSAPDPTVLGGSLGVKVTTLCVHIPPGQPRHNRGIKTPSAVLEPCLATDRLDDGRTGVMKIRPPCPYKHLTSCDAPGGRRWRSEPSDGLLDEREPQQPLLQLPCLEQAAGKAQLQRLGRRGCTGDATAAVRPMPYRAVMVLAKLPNHRSPQHGGLRSSSPLLVVVSRCHVPAAARVLAVTRSRSPSMAMSSLSSDLLSCFACSSSDSP